MNFEAVWYLVFLYNFACFFGTGVKIGGHVKEGAQAEDVREYDTEKGILT